MKPQAVPRIRPDKRRGSTEERRTATRGTVKRQSEKERARQARRRDLFKTGMCQQDCGRRAAKNTKLCKKCDNALCMQYFARIGERQPDQESGKYPAGLAADPRATDLTTTAAVRPKAITPSKLHSLRCSRGFPTRSDPRSTISIPSTRIELSLGFASCCSNFQLLPRWVILISTASTSGSRSYQPIPA